MGRVRTVESLSLNGPLNAMSIDELKAKRFFGMLAYRVRWCVVLSGDAVGTFLLITQSLGWAAGRWLLFDRTSNSSEVLFLPA